MAIQWVTDLEVGLKVWKLQTLICGTYWMESNMSPFQLKTYFYCLIHFMRPQSLILKPHKDSERKENYRPLLLWKLMQKYWIKYLQTASKNPSKIIIHHDQVSFNSEIQGWINIQNSINAIFYINKLTEKSIWSFSLDNEKSPWYNPTLPPDKILERWGIQGTHLSI